MSNLAIAEIPTSEKRIIGSVNGKFDGPTVIMLAGMHGNERAGVEAVINLLDVLFNNEQIQSNFHGKLLCLRANTAALEKGVRYVDEDMNRIWFPAILEQIRNTPDDAFNSSERREIKQLLKILDNIPQDKEHPVILADVHTFSAEGWMFSITNSEPRQRRLLANVQAPMVFGIEKTLRGTALGYYQQEGYISFGLEGGQHENKLTAENTMAALMLLLKASGCIDAKHFPDIKDYEKQLKWHTRNLPVETELVYQHIIEPGDSFEMRPGYKNFQPVKKGEWLANDQDGKILAQCDGYILMPLYQSQGNDGFFIIKERG